mgnify:CR=1 FL=1
MHHMASNGRNAEWNRLAGTGLLCLMLAGAAGPGCETQQPAGPTVTGRQTSAQAVPPSELQRGTRRVLQGEDGNTLVLGSGHRVRLLGVDAPEARHLEAPVQRFGQEAAEFLRNLALGRDCTLKYEGAGFYDSRGRLLAYVFVNGRMLNEELLRSGYAFVNLEFPFAYEAKFMEIEHDARAKQLGLWTLSLRDSRIANLVSRYDALNKDGRMRLDSVLEELIVQYPARPVKATNVLSRPQPVPPQPVPVQPEAAPVPPKPEPPRTILPGTVVPWTEAARYYGKQVVVEGEVAATYRSEAVCFLNFNPDYNKDFFAVIHSAAFPLFPPNPETFYKGKRIRVSGVVKEYKGRPQIMLESPKQVEIME